VAEDGMPVNGDSSTSEEEYLEQHQNVETPLETQPETEETDGAKNWNALREKVLEKQLQQLLSAHRWRAKIFDMLIGAMICQILSWVMQMLSSGH